MPTGLPRRRRRTRPARTRGQGSTRGRWRAHVVASHGTEGAGARVWPQGTVHPVVAWPAADPEEERMAATETGAETFHNFIDGESAAAADGRTMSVVNPADGREMAQAPDSGAEDVDRAVKAARAAFAGWSQTTPGERSLALLRFADALEAHGDELAELEARNAGKPLQAVKDDEIPAMVDNVSFFASAARNLDGKAAGEYVEGYTSWLRREPVGVIGQIAPWNYPMMMAIWKIGPALATGNT